MSQTEGNYRSDLRNALENMHDSEPGSDILNDPARLKEALSIKSPPNLVAKIAAGLSMEQIETLLPDFSTFEQARIIHFSGRDNDRAEKLYQRVMSTLDSPHAGLAAANLAGLMAAKGDLEGSESMYLSAINVFNCTGAYHMYAYHLFVQRDYQNAERFAVEGIKKGSAEALDVLAIMLYEKNQKDWREAMQPYLRMAQEHGIDEERLQQAALNFRGKMVIRTPDGAVINFASRVKREVITRMAGLLGMRYDDI
ncbi:hypothetical protein HY463_00280 [Candidatus Peregrinibacteria bacterium]|nr:hypothetical protein [Candidatus Peregrinibacteria bacterium]